MLDVAHICWDHMPSPFVKKQKIPYILGLRLGFRNVFRPGVDRLALKVNRMNKEMAIRGKGFVSAVGTTSTREIPQQH